jgi:hypothetical protein
MKRPKTTKDKPYIEFRYSKNGKLHLSATSDWWGGIQESFHCSDGSSGNTCLPKDLDRYIASFNKKKVKEIEKEIQHLQKRLNEIKDK